MSAEPEPPADLNEQLVAKLRKAKRLHERAMRYPVGSNGRRKFLERSREWMDKAFILGAKWGVTKAEVGALANDAGIAQITEFKVPVTP